ncbi:SPRY domain-containing protein [Podospora conica]|nr:SPRY domain-containing protein [Schizothecium conicum]
MTNPFQHTSSSFADNPLFSPAPLGRQRRSSYASVASGVPGALARPPRSAHPVSHLLNPSADYDMQANYYAAYRNSRMAAGMNMGRHGIPGEESDPAGWSSRASNSLPWFSRAFDSYTTNDPLYSNFSDDAPNFAAAAKGPSFLSPSYLRGSVYLQKLDEAHKARVLAERESFAAKMQSGGGIAAVGGPQSPNSKRPASSHRGVQFEVVEKTSVPKVDPTINPLPSRWNRDDKDSSLEVMDDGCTVKHTGRSSSDHEACAIRADHYMPPLCGVYYFEVTVLNRKREDTTIGIGFSTQSVSLQRAPGWEPDSWGYHGDDGNCFSAQNVGKAYGPKFGPGDTVGCLVNFRQGQASFTKNGDLLGVAFRNLDLRESKVALYPTVGLKRPGDHVMANFGQVPFQFDIDGYVKVSTLIIPEVHPSRCFCGSPTPESHFSHAPTNMLFDLRTPVLLSSLHEFLRLRILRKKQKKMITENIKQADTSKLAPGLSETKMIQFLVLQFLQHDGYVETARAFAEEINSEQVALNLDPNKSIPGINIKDDEDANNRQRIRRAILDGDIDRALMLVKRDYPKVLQQNEQVYFRLRCRKFIEMIRREAEHNSLVDRRRKSRYNHPTEDDDEDMMGSDTNSWDDRMDTEEGTDSTPVSKLSHEALAYGIELRAEFQNDPRKEVSKHLDEIFGLMAYPNPLKEKDVAHLLDVGGRVGVAEELNSAILLSLGKSSRAALENLYAQTSVLLEELRQDGGDGAFVTVQSIIDQIPVEGTF